MLSSSLFRISRSVVQHQQRNMSKHLKAFATLDPDHLSPANKGMNLVGGEWVPAAQYKTMIDPLNGKPMVSYPDT